MTETCFKFKASFSPCAIVQLTRYDLDALAQQLGNTIRKASDFFSGSPVVLDLEKVKTYGELNFVKIKEIFLKQGLALIGIRSGGVDQQEAAAAAGLPLLGIGKSAFTESSKQTADHHASATNTKLIINPIRSGTQVYAKGGDLVVVAQVSPGAELLSDGHIHVYGSLHGRALAGVLGDKTARIFCRRLDAELVSIAGYYLVKEDIPVLSSSESAMIQIYLDGEQVRIEVI